MARLHSIFQILIVLSHLCIKFVVSLDWLGIIADSYQNSPKSRNLSPSFPRGGGGVCLEWRVRIGISNIEEVADNNTYIGSTRHHEVFWCPLGDINHKIGLYCYTRQLSGYLCFTTAQTSWRALPNSQSQVSVSYPSLEDLVTLLTGKCGSHLYRPQKIEVHLPSTDLTTFMDL
jgi:hypothetical protein